VVKPVVKKNAGVKKVVPTKKVAPKKPVKPEVKKVVTKTVVQKTAKPVVAVKLHKEPAKKTIKENIPVAIKKPVKKKEVPLKEVKIPKTSVKTSKPYSPLYQPLENRMAKTDDNEVLMRYSDAELEEFRTLINKKLADASREVAYLQGIITRKDDMGGDVDGRYMTMEDGTVSMEREQMSQMVSRQISFIDNLKKALIRIENKTY
ncbi:TraR/DksA family transcriptional regulator, partial [Arachidicoccus sp.]|uniref:TraR/DksA family transcriptional regulator n=1 Tax=Arachidicoccus sp. TaxID=1872624 RepID=UPI003D20D2B8